MARRDLDWSDVEADARRMADELGIDVPAYPDDFNGCDDCGALAGRPCITRTVDADDVPTHTQLPGPHYGRTFD